VHDLEQTGAKVSTGSLKLRKRKSLPDVREFRHYEVWVTRPSTRERLWACYRARSSLDALTNSLSASGGPEGGNASEVECGSPRANEKIFRCLSRKIVPNGTIDMKNSVGVGGGVQNRQSGCYRRMPFLAPIKGDFRQGAEQLIPASSGQEAGYLGIRPRTRSCA